MPKSIYLINPKADFPNYYGADIYAHLGLTPVVGVADLTITTVAAMMPDDFEIAICDEQVTPVNFDHPADFVGITGKLGQGGRIIELAQEFQQRGKIVIIGGPYATMTPDTVRPYCNILVRGEIEAIAPQLFADLGGGDWQTEYTADGHPELSLSPVPRWDLYPNEQAMAGCVQTSRGCPFECEFCDVVQYAGRKQRHKSIEQVLAELDLLYKYGYHHIFFADDNFTISRNRTKKLLTAIRNWNNNQPEGRLTFSTQLSIDVTQDDEILQLCIEAGIHEVFVGLETPNEMSLRESKKHQNVGINLLDQIQRFLEYGIIVMGGMIVGFDSDGLDIFERQYHFAMATPIPIFLLNPLVAPNSTPLYARLQKDNRLTDERNYLGQAWNTNIIPKQMTRTQLFTGLPWLANKLYHPAAFGRRVLQLIDSYKLFDMSTPQKYRKPNRPIDMAIIEVVQNICNLGPEEAHMFSEVVTATTKKSFPQGVIMHTLLRYAQIRHAYQQTQLWRPDLAEQASPNFNIPETQ